MLAQQFQTEHDRFVPGVFQFVIHGILHFDATKLM
jgi:hypothetical protein